MNAWIKVVVTVVAIVTVLFVSLSVVIGDNGVDDNGSVIQFFCGELQYRQDIPEEHHEAVLSAAKMCDVIMAGGE